MLGLWCGIVFGGLSLGLLLGLTLCSFGMVGLIGGVGDVVESCVFCIFGGFGFGFETSQMRKRKTSMHFKEWK